MAAFKLQSAMEYLMTYGWAILIIAVVLGALFELGYVCVGRDLQLIPSGIIRNPSWVMWSMQDVLGSRTAAAGQGAVYDDFHEVVNTTPLGAPLYWLPP